MLPERLREETRPWHDRLENGLDLLNHCLTQQDYQVLLERFYGYYRPVERELFLHPEWPSTIYDPVRRGKISLLENDLRVLGCSTADIASLPLCSALPSLTDFPAALGCAYVLEGATLGGQVISAHLQRVLDITPETGGRFFAGYGTETGSMWKAFRSLLTEYGERFPQHEQEVITAASETFSSLADWLLPVTKQ